ncbi:MAG: polyamine aminopropyltransferase [Hyphomicrobiales bacterium]|nr:polyamine aminopropyltransferase [Hyphomicrobiales bacterium]
MTRWIDETLHAHLRCTLEASKVLFEQQTDYQNLIIFENDHFGRVMMLDGVVQLTESDEFIYHEMMAHVGMLSLGNARRILIIGGGDGGVMREVLRYGQVERVVMCELDKTVVEASLEFLPSISQGAFDDPRVELKIGDGVAYVAECKEKFDLVIVDSTEPIGPATPLFGDSFFENCNRILNQPGVLIAQNGLPFMHPEHLSGTAQRLKRIFADSACFLCTQPTYFGGPFALVFASNDLNLRTEQKTQIEPRYNKAGLETRYYNPATHKAAFVLPNYVKRIWQS